MPERLECEILQKARYIKIRLRLRHGVSSVNSPSPTHEAVGILAYAIICIVFEIRRATVGLTDCLRLPCAGERWRKVVSPEAKQAAWSQRDAN